MYILISKNIVTVVAVVGLEPALRPPPVVEPGARQQQQLRQPKGAEEARRDGRPAGGRGPEAGQARVAPGGGVAAQKGPNLRAAPRVRCAGPSAMRGKQIN